MKQTKIFSVFPACGKTWVAEHQDELGITVLDSDSSKFSWKEEDIELCGYGIMINGELRPATRKTKVRNPDFPYNYIQHIEENIGRYDYIFVSSHKEVRKALNESKIDFTIVYPDKSCLNEWIGRCYLRELNGSNGFPIRVLVDNWDNWIDQCKKEGKTHDKIVLGRTEYLSDRIFDIWTGILV